MLRNKSKVAIALLLTLSFAISMFAVLPNANGAVTAVPDRATGAYISTNPDVIGINQELTVNLWVYPSPDGPHGEMGLAQTGLTGALVGIHFTDLTVTFTRPDGSKDTFMPAFGSTALGFPDGVTDEVGGLWFSYKPSQIGTWSVSFSFPGNTFTAKNYSVYYKPSTSQIITFTVQQDNVQIGFPPVQLPTDFWKRPINPENREWSTISGNWVDNIIGNFNPYSTAPNSAHILWTKQLFVGGLIGGEWGTTSYDPRSFGYGVPAAILNGRLYYQIPTASGVMMTCVDLLTGALIWQLPGSISKIQLAPTAGLFTTGLSVGEKQADYSTTAAPNIWEFGGSAWKRYDAWTGTLNLNIPKTMPYVGGPVWQGLDIAYCLTNAGIAGFGGLWNSTTMTRPFMELIKWNLSKPGTTWEDKIVYKVDLLNRTTGLGPGESSRGASFRVQSDTLGIVTESCSDMFYGIDLNTGKVLWSHRIPFYQMSTAWTPDGHLIAVDSATMTIYCYEVPSWKELWSSQVGKYPWASQGTAATSQAYGNFYAASYDGYLYCVDLATGKIEWEFYVGDTTETIFGTWPVAVSAIADGKVYMRATEHGPTQPVTRGWKEYCVDAYTGEPIWNMTGTDYWLGGAAIADGYFVRGTGQYDGMMTCFGKGKTDTEVMAPLTAVTLGQSLTVQGTVMDLSPASAGTPAISDVDMSAWMEYLHMQKPIPMNAKGVEVSLDTVDPNNNFVHIATVTSDSSGLYSYKWKPEVPGKYTVIATFAGSESYWASYAETAVSVDEAPAATPSAETIVPDNTPIYTAIIAAAIAIIIAVAIVGILLLRKR